MTAAIIEFDALTDTVWTAAENDDLLAIRNLCLGARLTDEWRFIGRVHVGGWRSEFCSAGIDALVNRMHIKFTAQLCDILCVLARQAGEARIGEAHGLQHTQVFCILWQTVFANTLFGLHNGFDLFEEPRIDLGRIVNLLGRQTKAHCLSDHAQTVWRRRADGSADRVLLIAFFNIWNGDFIKARQAGFEAAKRLLQAFLESTANGHDFTDRLHCSGQDWRRAREFFECKARDLGDDIVDRWFERCRCRAAGDVVVEFIQCVADSKLCRDLGNREAGCLGSESRRTRHAWVHFNHDHAAIGRVDRELHVGATGFNADLAQHRNRGVTHDLVFFVGQRQRWCNGD